MHSTLFLLAVLVTLSFVPKFLGTALVLALLGPWLLRALERFAVHIWGGFAGMLT